MLVVDRDAVELLEQVERDLRVEFLHRVAQHAQVAVHAQGEQLVPHFA